MKRSKFFKTLIMFVFSLFLINNVSSQNFPSIIVDGEEVLIPDFAMFPFWLNTGQTIEIGANTKFISVVQYNEVPTASANGNDLIYENVVKVTAQQLVPSGKVWKVESVGLDMAAAIVGPTGPTGPTGPIGVTGPIGPGNVVSVTGTSPIVSSGGSNPDISLQGTTGGVAYGTGTGSAFTGAGTSGQVLTSNGLSAPSWGNVQAQNLIGITTLTSTASGSIYTPTPGTNMIKIIVIGGGGAGGGSSSNAYYLGGGASGGYLIKIIKNFTGTAEYQCGVGGVGGNGTGGNGGSTSFTYGGITYTASGGNGGEGGTGKNFFIGGMPGVLSTNGDINGYGMPGYHGGSNLGPASGYGGSSILGGGGFTKYSDSNGMAGACYGAGGGGAASASGPRTGGNGKQGAIIIYEYQ